MNNETRTIWISIGVGFFAMMLLFSWSQEKSSSLLKRYGAEKQVLVAAKDIPEMTPIDDTMIQPVSRPAEFVEPSAISLPEHAIGQLAAAPIKKGEQILDTKLLLPSQKTGLSMEVTPGKRAFTLPVDDIRGVSRLIKPGNRVDIMAALNTGSGTSQKTEVRTILQDVVVLATGANIANQLPIKVEEERTGVFSIENLRMDTRFSSVVVEVSPEDVQNLVYILATAPGSLFLALRNTNDRAINNLRTTGLQEVLGRSMGRTPAQFTPDLEAPRPRTGNPRLNR
jgi:pilus assembly protein CpaB